MDINKISEFFLHVPVINIVPVFLKLLKDLPLAWEDLPEEKKKEYLQSFIAAGAKAAAEYASK